MSDEIVVEYRSRAVISDDKVEFNPTDNTRTIYEQKGLSSSDSYRVYAFMEHMVLYTVIFHLTLKASFNIMMPKAARSRDRWK